MDTIKLILAKKGLILIWPAERLGKSINMVNTYAYNCRQPSAELLYQIANLWDVGIKNYRFQLKKDKQEYGY